MTTAAATATASPAHATSQTTRPWGRRTGRCNRIRSVAIGATSVTATIAASIAPAIRVDNHSRDGKLRSRLAQLERRERELVRPLNRREGDREILDRKAGRVEHRRVVSAATSIGVAGEDLADLGHVLATKSPGFDCIDDVAVVTRLLPVGTETTNASELLDGNLSFARAVRAHQARVLPRPERTFPEHELAARRDRHEKIRRQGLLP